MTLAADKLPHQELRNQVDKIATSKPFVASKRMQRFLSYIVDAKLSASEDRLKESVLGVEVFDRDPGFDPKEDPIVRVEARRLRAKLEEYYQQYGMYDPYLIQVPKGCYIPEIITRPAPQPVRVPSFPTLMWQYAASFLTGLR